MLVAMKSTQRPGEELILSLASAWSRLERSIDANLASIRGISFAEYRLLRALADDLELGFDPLDCEMGNSWDGEKPEMLLSVSADPWRGCRCAISTLSRSTAPPGCSQ